MAMAEDRLTQLMGVGHLGEIRQAPTGDLYEWTEGIDGLGNPIGFWKFLRRMAPRIRTALRRGQLMPIARLLPTLIPGWGPAIAAGMATGAPLLRRVGLADGDGLGEVYEGLDGELYEVEGLAEEDLSGLDEAEILGLAEDEMRGFAEDELRGIDEADALSGYGEADVLTGYGEADVLTGYGEAAELTGLEEAELLGLAEDEMRGFAEDELRGIDEADALTGYGEAAELTGLEEADLQGLAEDEMRGFAEDELRGIDEAAELAEFGEPDDTFKGIDGYAFEPGMRGLDAYVPSEPPTTRLFVRPKRPPEIWKPLW
jgi:hypothetical protein